jgi:gas vesicle protein
MDKKHTTATGHDLLSALRRIEATKERPDVELLKGWYMVFRDIQDQLSQRDRKYAENWFLRELESLERTQALYKPTAEAPALEKTELHNRLDRELDREKKRLNDLNKSEKDVFDDLLLFEKRYIPFINTKLKAEPAILRFVQECVRARMQNLEESKTDVRKQIQKTQNRIDELDEKIRSELVRQSSKRSRKAGGGGCKLRRGGGKNTYRRKSPLWR